MCILSGGFCREKEPPPDARDEGRQVTAGSPDPTQHRRGLQAGKSWRHS